MTSKRHKVKNREPDTYPSCILCGKGDLGPYTLQVVQAGGEEPVWTHGHWLPGSDSRGKALWPNLC